VELGELVAVVVGDAASEDCLFGHRPREHKEENVLPPPDTKNNATRLSAALEAQSMHLSVMDVTVADEPAKVHFSAHHLIPGNETWPKSKLYKWIDKRKGHVCGDIGYDVNECSNGIDLPSHEAVPGWKACLPTYQSDYAFVAMLADGAGRQFHDRHAAYSDFVINTIDKIAAKLEAKDKPGCGKKNCGGSKEKPYDPPYEVKPRLEGVAGRLKQKLVGFAQNWHPPVMTSRFALMLKGRAAGMTQTQARKVLARSAFKY
jgi:hypothetical protein